MRVTPENIQTLEPDQVFVFGSNRSGIHGGGAARLAHLEFGAEWGIGEGATGQCYALPTKSEGIIRTLNINEIKEHVDTFLKHVKDRPMKVFLVTEVGCGLAGLNPEDVAPLFTEAIYMSNVWLPKRFIDIINRIL